MLSSLHHSNSVRCRHILDAGKVIPGVLGALHGSMEDGLPVAAQHVRLRMDGVTPEIAACHDVPIPRVERDVARIHLGAGRHARWRDCIPAAFLGHLAHPFVSVSAM
jgi:hypothetical protein